MAIGLIVFLMLPVHVDGLEAETLDAPWAIRKGVEAELFVICMKYYKTVGEYLNQPIDTREQRAKVFGQSARVLRIGDSVQEVVLTSAGEKRECGE